MGWFYRELDEHDIEKLVDEWRDYECWKEWTDFARRYYGSQAQTVTLSGITDGCGYRSVATYEVRDRMGARLAPDFTSPGQDTVWRELHSDENWDELVAMHRTVDAILAALALEDEDDLLGDEACVLRVTDWGHSVRYDLDQPPQRRWPRIFVREDDGLD